MCTSWCLFFSSFLSDDVSVKLKEKRDVCIAMTPPLSRFPFCFFFPCHCCHSLFVQPHHLDPLGALDQLAVNDMKCTQSARVCRKRNSVQISVHAAELGLRGGRKSTSTRLWVFAGLFFCVYSAAVLASANQVIFTLTSQKVIRQL